MNTDELIRKQTNWIKAVFGCLAAIVVAIVIFGVLLVPKIYKAIDGLSQSLSEINVLVDDADEAILQINEVDFDHLNQSINDLSTITSKFANFFNRFN